MFKIFQYFMPSLKTLFLNIYIYGEDIIKFIWKPQEKEIVCFIFNVQKMYRESDKLLFLETPFNQPLLHKRYTKYNDPGENVVLLKLYLYTCTYLHITIINYFLIHHGAFRGKLQLSIIILSMWKH